MVTIAAPLSHRHWHGVVTLDTQSVVAQEPILLERILYTSKATDPMGTLELFKLLNHARQKNAGQDITGHLLYLNGAFTQCLEGPSHAIDTLWDVLLKDPRHHDIQLVSRTSIHQRRFSEWSMAFSSYRYLNAFNMSGFFPVNEDGKSAKSDLCQA